MRWRRRLFDARRAVRRRGEHGEAARGRGVLGRGQRVPAIRTAATASPRSTTSSASSARPGSTGRAGLHQPDPRVPRRARARHAALLLIDPSGRRQLINSPGERPAVATCSCRYGSGSAGARRISAAAASPSPALDRPEGSHGDRCRPARRSRASSSLAGQVGLEDREDRLRRDPQQRVARAVEHRAVELLVVAGTAARRRRPPGSRPPSGAAARCPRRCGAARTDAPRTPRAAARASRNSSSVTSLASDSRPMLASQERGDVVDRRQRHEGPAAGALGGPDQGCAPPARGAPRGPSRG